MNTMTTKTQGGQVCQVSWDAEEETFALTVGGEHWAYCETIGEAREEIQSIEASETDERLELIRQTISEALGDCEDEFLLGKIARMLGA